MVKNTRAACTIIKNHFIYKIDMTESNDKSDYVLQRMKYWYCIVPIAP